MISIAKTFSALVLVTLAFSTTAGCDNVTEALDCHQMCEKMEACLDDSIDVNNCAERCEDRVDDDTLAERLDACTDCLDHGVSCREVASECPACDEVQMALLP